MPEYKGTCFCGAVEVTATGEPAAMGYCHCESCRHWSAGPINAFTLWKPEAVALGWPKRAIGFRRLLQLATSGAGWATYGLPKQKDFPAELGGSGVTLAE